MGKAAVFAIVAFGVMGAYYATGMQRSTSEAAARVSDYQREMLARNAALVGHERAEQALAENAGTLSSVPASLSGTYKGVPYDVTIAVSGVQAVVTSVGMMGDDVAFTIQSAYYEKEEVETGIAEQPPKHMQYAILAEKDLSLGGNVDAEIYADGNASDKLNANMHSNGSFEAKGNVDVKGFATSVGSATVQGNSEVSPNYNPTDAEAVQGYVEPVEIPAFDAVAFLDAMGGADQTSNSMHFEANETYDLGGTREDPYVWHVKDELKISGNVKFSGYVMFIVEDYIQISGNVEMGTVNYDGPDESTIALYTGGNADISVTGNATLYGQIFAYGDVKLAGNVDVYGNITTHGAVSLHGNTEIYYRSASPALTRMWNEPTKEMYIASHTEW